MKYHGQKEKVALVNYAIGSNVPCLLIGETGTGKTTLVRELAKEAGKEIVRFNLTGETTVDDFVGKYTLKEGNTVWQDGILLTAMKRGQWLVLDEVNVALPEILFILHSLLDDDRFVVVATHDGEKVVPHKDFRFFATMNPVDEYAGTKELNKAFLSRFPVIVEVPYPDAETEIAILMERGEIDKDLATKMVAVAHEIRTAKEKNEVFYTCSTRDLIQWAEIARHIGAEAGLTATLIPKSGRDSEMVKKIAMAIERDFISLNAKHGTTNIMQHIEDELDKIKKAKAKLAKSEDDLRAEIRAEIIAKL